MILFGSSEFGFIRFGDSFTTGSSMMPQKRNPDAMEIARGFAARSLGGITSILATMKGLPSGYNKDLQDDKRILFDVVDSALLVLPAVTGALAESTFQVETMERAVSSGMMATDLADYLVGKGVSFRDAHGAVGSLVRAAEEASCELSELPAERFTSAHAAFGADARNWLDARASIARRDVAGGTGPNAVRDQIEAAKSALSGAPTYFKEESGPRETSPHM
jgi:argininosuccinate lyase